MVKSQKPTHGKAESSHRAQFLEIGDHEREMRWRTFLADSQSIARADRFIEIFLQSDGAIRHFMRLRGNGGAELRRPGQVMQGIASILRP